jgi:hypothetical protein
MNRLAVSVAKFAEADSLNGQWMEILHVGTDDGETYTPADLDEMVREYKSRADGSEAPVSLGLPSQGDSAPIGKIEALRRVGDSLQAKFTGIDPRVEHLYGRGVFSKKFVQVVRKPDGDSLRRIGLIHPVYSAGASHDNMTPSLEELMKRNTGNKEHSFGDGGRRGGWIGFESELGLKPSASAVVDSLKARGYWSNRYDRAGIQRIFGAVDHTPAVGSMATLLIGLRDNVNNCDPGRAVLSECARYWARTRGVSFCEALDHVSQTAWNPSGDPLTDAARARQKEKNLSFGEALEQIAEEQPELTWLHSK